MSSFAIFVEGNCPCICGFDDLLITLVGLSNWFSFYTLLSYFIALSWPNLQSPVDGKPMLLTPEESIHIQVWPSLGSFRLVKELDLSYQKILVIYFCQFPPFIVVGNECRTILELI